MFTHHSTTIYEYKLEEQHFVSLHMLRLKIQVSYGREA